MRRMSTPPSRPLRSAGSVVALLPLAIGCGSGGAGNLLGNFPNGSPTGVATAPPVGTLPPAPAFGSPTLGTPTVGATPASAMTSGTGGFWNNLFGGGTTRVSPPPTGAAVASPPVPTFPPAAAPPPAFNTAPAGYGPAGYGPTSFDAGTAIGSGLATRPPTPSPRPTGGMPVIDLTAAARPAAPPVQPIVPSVPAASPIRQAAFDGSWRPSTEPIAPPPTRLVPTGVSPGSIPATPAPARPSTEPLRWERPAVGF